MMRLVKKIVQGSFGSFRAMYKPIVQEYAAEGLLKFQHYTREDTFKQDCGLSATNFHFSSLPCIPQSQMAVNIGGKHGPYEAGCMALQPLISSREEAVTFVRKALRRKVMASSARQAVSGVLAAGGSSSARYLARKISKSWQSRAR